MSEPYYFTCQTTSCGRPSLGGDNPYCDHHIPYGRLVNNEQVARARKLLRLGVTLYQAAARVRADVRDLDVALWERTGVPMRESDF